VVNLPNLISLARLLCVPVTVWLIVTNEFAAAFWVFVGAGVSDAIDGFIAKRFNARTALGQYIDPLADKALLVSVYITLGFHGALPDWLVILVVFRDLLIVGGALLFLTLTDHPVRMDPLWISKLNTLMQLTLAAAVLGGKGFGIGDHGLMPVLTFGVAATTVLSGGAYIRRWLRTAAGVSGT
jgi:cardiolipin synthase